MNNVKSSLAREWAAKSSLAREWAAKMAKCSSREQQDSQVMRVLKHSGAYNGLKEQIEMARKPRMRTVEQFVCDGCDVIIQNEDEGYIIQGNIYTANLHRPGGLIGDNFPKVEKGEKIDLDMVMKNVLCRKCFMRAMGLDQLPVKTRLSNSSNPSMPSKPVSSNVAKELEQILGRGDR